MAAPLLITDHHLMVCVTYWHHHLSIIKLAPAFQQTFFGDRTNRHWDKWVLAYQCWKFQCYYTTKLMPTYVRCSITILVKNLYIKMNNFY